LADVFENQGSEERRLIFTPCSDKYIAIMMEEKIPQRTPDIANPREILLISIILLLLDDNLYFCAIISAAHTAGLV
jgi:hypothetical protein